MNDTSPAQGNSAINLQTELIAFYADMEHRLAVCEEIPQMFPAHPDNPDREAYFFADSRNQRPGEIRAMVKLAKALEKAAKERDDDMSECCSAGFENAGWPDCDICTKCKEHSSPCLTEAAEAAQTALREILADWRNQ